LKICQVLKKSAKFSVGKLAKKKYNLQTKFVDFFDYKRKKSFKLTKQIIKLSEEIFALKRLIGPQFLYADSSKRLKAPSLKN